MTLPGACACGDDGFDQANFTQVFKTQEHVEIGAGDIAKAAHLVKGILLGEDALVSVGAAKPARAEVHERVYEAIIEVMAANLESAGAAYDLGI